MINVGGGESGEKLYCVFIYYGLLFLLDKMGGSMYWRALVGCLSSSRVSPSGCIVWREVIGTVWRGGGL